MNPFRRALNYIAIGGLVLGALIVLFSSFGLGDNQSGPNVGAIIGIYIGSALFSLGLVALFFWLLAESIAHGQRAMIQTLERIADQSDAKTDA
jgi:hypothetical protein